MADKFASLLIKLKVNIDHYVVDLSNSDKILFLVGELGITSPRDICCMTNMAKSNLAILASKLRHKKYIEQYKTKDNNKEILYRITDAGKAKLDYKLSKISLSSEEKDKLMNHVEELLNFSRN